MEQENIKSLTMISTETLWAHAPVAINFVPAYSSIHTRVRVIVTDVCIAVATDEAWAALAGVAVISVSADSIVITKAIFTGDYIRIGVSLTVVSNSSWSARTVIPFT